MHVALGGQKKTNLTLLGAGPLIDRCRDLKRKNEQKRLLALNAIRDVSRLDKCVSDYKQLASALAHPNCPPRAGRVLSSLLQQGRSVPHCLEMLQRGYRAKYTQNERDFGLLTLRIGGPRLLHAANHAGCAPSRDQVLPKHKHRPIAYGKMITAEDMLAVLPSKLPFCAYSICVDEVAVEGDIVPSLVGGASPVLYGFCMEHAGVLEIQSESDLLALRQQLEAGTIHRASVCAVWLIVPMHREVHSGIPFLMYASCNKFTRHDMQDMLHHIYTCICGGKSLFRPSSSP